MRVGVSHITVFSKQPAISLFRLFSSNTSITIISYNNGISVALEYCYKRVRLYLTERERGWLEVSRHSLLAGEFRLGAGCLRARPCC